MYFDIRIDGHIEDKTPVLQVLLFTKKEEYYLDGGEEGIYNCACTVADDICQLTSTIKQSVNACLETYEKELLETLNDIIKKNEPKLKEFNDFIWK